MNTSIKKHNMDVIKRPRITEKAAIASEKGTYVFEVTGNATKAAIKAAVKELYKVTPVSVNVAKNPVKKTYVRGKKGTKGGVVKAYVTLKKGDKIELA
ncbi:MAG: 50S ribosomal protein L23 [Candidatus Taylorbacteria bacterium]|nr:50S ribosomal protein L23 [Candidatus Taylorbacteria bacterium]